MDVNVTLSFFICFQYTFYYVLEKNNVLADGLGIILNQPGQKRLKISKIMPKILSNQAFFSFEGFTKQA